MKLQDNFLQLKFLTGGGWSAAGKNARLYFHDDHDNKRIAAWCVGSWDDFKRDPYIQVDLGSSKNIQYIATQGIYSQIFVSKSALDTGV